MRNRVSQYGQVLHPETCAPFLLFLLTGMLLYRLLCTALRPTMTTQRIPYTHSLKKLLAITAVSAFPLVPASNISAHPVATIGELSAIQSDTLLLKAKLDRATVQHALDAKKHLRAASSNHPAHVVSNMPVVTAVYGTDNRLYAAFLYPSGATAEARTGETIPGPFEVVSVSTDKVRLMQNKQTFQAPFSAIATKPAAEVAGLPGRQAW